MNLKKILINGTAAGLAMGLALLLTGAIASYLLYGTWMAPLDKFGPSGMNTAYFLWTRLLIGWLFGILLTLVYAKVSLILAAKGVRRGLRFALAVWLVLSLWEISHPLVYERLANVFTYNRLFWNIYTLGGFLGYGFVLGLLNRNGSRPDGASPGQR